MDWGLILKIALIAAVIMVVGKFISIYLQKRKEWRDWRRRFRKDNGPTPKMVFEKKEERCILTKPNDKH